MKILAETAIEGGKKIEFEFEGRNCILCIPDNPRADKRVLWRAEFFYAFENCDVEMFKMGYYRAYIGVSNMFGSPAAVEIMKKFHDFLVSEFGLCDRMILVGLSRGGLYSVNYAATYPDDIMALYLDAPVMSVANWPFGKGKTERNETEVGYALEAFGMTEEEIFAAKLQPLDNVEKVAKAGIPIVLVCGDADTIVDHLDNAEAFLDKFKALDGKYEYYVKHGCGHHPHGLEDPKPIINFLEKCR